MQTHDHCSHSWGKGGFEGVETKVTAVAAVYMRSAHFGTTSNFKFHFMVEKWKCE